MRAEDAVLEGECSHLEHLAQNEAEEPDDEEAGHKNQNGRNDHARNVADAIERNTVGDFTREAHAQHEAGHPADDREHFADDAAHDAHHRRKERAGHR